MQEQTSTPASKSEVPANKNKKWLLIGCSCLLILLIAGIVVVVAGGFLAQRATNTLVDLGQKGVDAAQLTARDMQRQNTIKNVNIDIMAYYTTNAKYPTSDDSLLTTNQLVIGNSTGNPQTIDLSGPLSALSTTQTTSTGSVYCYAIEPDGYMLGVKLEADQTWYNVGSSSQKCTDANIIQPKLGA